MLVYCWEIFFRGRRMERSVFFDQNVDPSHKLCYLEENKWYELENLVKVSQIDKNEFNLTRRVRKSRTQK